MRGDGRQAGRWLFASADWTNTCEILLDGASADRLLIEEPATDCNCEGTPCLQWDASAVLDSCWLAGLPQRDAIWKGAGEVFTAPASVDTSGPAITTG